MSHRKHRTWQQKVKHRIAKEGSAIRKKKEKKIEEEEWKKEEEQKSDY
jgi:hypothetical protein